jgi:hypothetical protein
MIKSIYPEFILNAIDVKFGDVQKLDASRTGQESKKNSYKLFVQTTYVDSTNIYLKLPFLQISHASSEIKSENSDYIELAIDYDKDDKENAHTFAFFDKIDKIFIDWITSNKRQLNPNNITGIKIRYKPFIRINKSKQDNKCIKLKIIKEIRNELTTDFITTMYGDLNNVYEPDMLFGSIIEIVGCIINNGTVIPLIRTDQCYCVKINRQITCCRKLNMCYFDEYEHHNTSSSNLLKLDEQDANSVDMSSSLINPVGESLSLTNSVDVSSLTNSVNKSPSLTNSVNKFSSIVTSVTNDTYPQLITNNQIVLDNDSDSEDVDIIKTYKK